MNLILINQKTFSSFIKRFIKTNFELKSKIIGHKKYHKKTNN